MILLERNSDGSKTVKYNLPQFSKEEFSIKISKHKSIE